MRDYFSPENLMGKKPKGKVVVITDAQQQEFLCSLSFKNQQVEVQPFSRAHDVIKDCRVDLILLDCSSDVDQALQILKENKTSCPKIPNIFISDVSQEGIVLRAFRAGARDFFTKPLNIPELQDTVAGLLFIKKSSREKRSPFIKTAS
jgi:AraC family transcriptional regulator